MDKERTGRSYKLKKVGTDIQGHSTWITRVYAINDNAKQEEKEDISKKLKDTVENAPPQHSIILGDDFNERVGNQKWTWWEKLENQR